MICQFMNHGEYRGEANIYVHHEVIAILRDMADKLLQKRTVYGRRQTIFFR